MASPTYVQPYGDSLMVMMDDGSQFLAIKSASNVWVVSGDNSGPPPPSSDKFSWPFDPSTMTSGYGPRVGPIGHFHEGMDFGYPPAVYGAKEFATADGVVEGINLNTNYGYSVQLGHGVDKNGYGIHTIYAHMNSNPVVKEGQHVKKGDLLGYLGGSGDAQGANHLHWETHTCPNNTPIVHNTMSTSTGLDIRTAIDPVDFMKKYGDGHVIPQ